MAMVLILDQMGPPSCPFLLSCGWLDPCLRLHWCTAIVAFRSVWSRPSCTDAFVHHCCGVLILPSASSTAVVVDRARPNQRCRHAILACAFHRSIDVVE
eukprot:scaffold2697_cov346-Pavlova_lutheri.AAC.10